LLTVVALVTYFMVNSIPGIIADVTLSLAPVIYFMVNSIPGVIAGVTLSLADEGQRYSYGCVPKPSNLNP
jgi:hypothetical protein